MIEFNCPSCQALIRVAEGAGGKKGSCPSCREKIVVPEKSGVRSTPAAEDAPPPSPPLDSQPADQPAFDELTIKTGPSSGNTDPIIQVVPEKGPGKKRRRKKSSAGGLLVPLLCAGVLFGFIGWYFLQTNSGLSPEVVGTVVEAPDIPPGLISKGDVSVDEELFEKVRESLESEKLTLVSATHLADVSLTAQPSGIIANVKPVSGAMCVRVSLDDTDVSDYVSDYAKEFNQYRMQRIQETSDQFISAWVAAMEAGEKTVPNLTEVRDHMALASVVSGFGYHIVAWDGKVASPCVGVGNSGELYFFLKPGTQSFVIRGRDVGGESPGFPGEIVVKVDRPNAPVTPQPEAETEEREEVILPDDGNGDFSDNKGKPFPEPEEMPMKEMREMKNEKEEP